MFVLFLVEILLALATAGLVPLDLPLAWALCWVLVRDEAEAIAAAFLGGVTLDTLAFNRIGSSSILYVVCVLGVVVYRRLKLSPQLFSLVPYLVLVFLVSFWLAQLLRFGTVAIMIPWWRLAGDVAATLLFLFIFYFFVGVKEKEPLKLRI